MIACRGCGKPDLTPVVDLGRVPAADHFPLAADPVGEGETYHELAMDLCGDCGLAQLADDDTIADEPRAVEPQALRDQAEEAIARVQADGYLRGSTVLEFGSPHGGTWIPLLTERGLRVDESRADVVLDCFGIMHEPDQREAFTRRANVVNPDGVLLLQYHSIVTIVEQGQWNALRHGHFAYYSLTALVRLLGDAGLSVVTAWEFDLYGGTVLIAAVHGAAEPDASVRRILDTEKSLDITSPDTMGGLQAAADQHVAAMRTWLEREAAAGRRILGYGAASRAVALFSRAGLNSTLLAAVADASPAKQGRRMPGTNIPIVAPEVLLAADPHRVLLTLPDLLPEVSARYPQLDGRWTIAGP
jgi:hypothetical protein